MSDQNGAREQLAKAVERLEAALGQMLERAGSARAELTRLQADRQRLDAEIDGLRGENAALREKLASLTADHRGLEDLTEVVSTRLDATINELKGMMGERDG